MTASDEGILSMTLNEGMYVMAEGLDSNNGIYRCDLNKPHRQDNSGLSGRFKGIVSQQNGHWGAQIYAKHQRIWLGTFKSEKEAAYDSAAIKLRSGDSYRNFPWTNLTIQEPNFQDLHTTEAVLTMIKDGSYQSKFMDFVRNQCLKMENKIELNLGKGCVDDGELWYQQLFQKELTPSDVGKLNRLVIPKKYAVKYFPPVLESLEEDEVGGGVNDVQLLFFDREMRSRKFRYCYWKSSQSFVFTRGWNRFVKGKRLNAKDVITFYRCEKREGFKEQSAFYVIDVGYNRSQSNSGFVGGFDGYTERKVGLQLGFGGSFESVYDRDRKRKVEEEEVVTGLEPPPAKKKKGIRLFGMQILG